MNAQIEIQLIAVFVSIAAALPGSFLVLRRMSMMSDAISHTILLGIVLAFFITRDLGSPLLLFGAALVGLLTVWVAELLKSTNLVKEDAAIGLIYPFFFSLAIILITQYAGSVHLDTDTVLLGELAFAPFDRLIVRGVDFGARGIYIAGFLMFGNLIIISALFKEFKIATFDPLLARSLGFSPVLINYILMSMVSITTVGVFQAVGSILVVAFMVGPPITAYLFTDDLKIMLILSCIIGAFNAVVGFSIADALDISIAGSMATVTGIVFLLGFVFSPQRGLLATFMRRRRQKKVFERAALLFHLYNHEGTEVEWVEASREDISLHFDWTEDFMNQILDELEREGLVQLREGIICLTPSGRNQSIEYYNEFFLKK